MAQDTGNAGPSKDDRVMEALVRIEKKADIILIIAILILAVGLGTAAAVAPQAMAGLFMVVFVVVAAVGIIGLPILFVYKAFRGRRTEKESEEEIHSNP